MRKELNLVTSLHTATKRDYLGRMNDSKVEAMMIAKQYGADYWDGDRKYGYGGYKYISNYLTPLAKKIIKIYKLNNKSKILDIGCGKGFLLYEIKKILPQISISGFDISRYAINKCPREIRNFLKVFDAKKKFNYKNKQFDLAMSLGCIHNLEIHDIKNFLSEITRVSKKQYIMTESYRNEKELFNLQCWALTCETFFSTYEWKWIFKEFKYNGDYELIYFE